ncbi:MAG TPA: FHA domain-containing protein, partial [Gemmatimonadales bacterium]|nr:FHA domain-containing protein [Gemmatimonadales bacterium]
AGMAEPEDREFEASEPAVEAEPEATDTFDPIDHARVIRQREAAAGIPELAGYALVVTDGPRQGAHWMLEEGSSEAGRNTSAFVFLDDITVSRHHAEFIVAQGRLEVRDLGSTNGTYVNGKRAERAELHPGDEVIIGRFHLVVAFGA